MLKIVGNIDDGYIISLRKSDLSRMLGAYISEKLPGSEKSVNELKVGDEISIEQISDMTYKIEQVSKKMIETMECFKSSQKSLTDFAFMVIKGE